MFAILLALGLCQYFRDGIFFPFRDEEISVYLPNLLGGRGNSAPAFFQRRYPVVIREDR